VYHCQQSPNTVYHCQQSPNTARARPTRSASYSLIPRLLDQILTVADVLTPRAAIYLPVEAGGAGHIYLPVDAGGAGHMFALLGGNCQTDKVKSEVRNTYTHSCLENGVTDVSVSIYSQHSPIFNYPNWRTQGSQAFLPRPTGPVVQQDIADLQEAREVERLGEYIGNRERRADPERDRDEVQELLAAVLEPALVVAVASSQPSVLNGQHGRLVVTFDGDGKRELELKAVGAQDVGDVADVLGGLGVGGRQSLLQPKTGARS
jgi:hypothetical protein